MMYNDVIVISQENEPRGTKRSHDQAVSTDTNDIEDMGMAIKKLKHPLPVPSLPSSQDIRSWRDILGPPPPPGVSGCGSITLFVVGRLQSLAGLP